MDVSTNGPTKRRGICELCRPRRRARTAPGWLKQISRKAHVPPRYALEDMHVVYESPRQYLSRARTGTASQKDKYCLFNSIVYRDSGIGLGLSLSRGSEHGQRKKQQPGAGQNSARRGGTAARPPSRRAAPRNQFRKPLTDRRPDRGLRSGTKSAAIEPECRELRR